MPDPLAEARLYDGASFVLEVGDRLDVLLSRGMGTWIVRRVNNWAATT
jgi:hypothetical protein